MEGGGERRRGRWRDGEEKEGRMTKTESKESQKERMTVTVRKTFRERAEVEQEPWASRRERSC